jgi:8-amino-7-oxononanoate synthase/dethiobiotin synthase
MTLSGATGPEAVIDGRRILQLCSNDYLGLAGDPRVREAAAAAAGRWGAGSGASRLVSGTLELHRELERALAAYKRCDGAVVFSSGYLANIGTIAALAGKEDAVFSDELNHASIIDGCRLSGARVVVYRHGDPQALEAALRSVPARRRLVVTDTVFSMDGDLAPLAEIAAVCDRHGAMLMVDEAHATGLLGPRGTGAVEAAGLAGRVGVVMATLSKALGASGGVVAGQDSLVEWLRNRARSYVFDTAPAPAAVGAAREALRIAEAEPQRRAWALEAARRLAAGLSDLGYRALAPAAAIVPVIIGDESEAVGLSARLLELGVLVPAIRPPSVPAGTSRLRVTVTAAHSEEHLARALEAFSAARPAHARPASTAPRRAGGPRKDGSHKNGTPLDSRILEAGGVFVTGTGTGVGKTVVAAALARTLAGAGLRVGAMKPVQTGAAAGADDLGFVRAAAGVQAGWSSAPYILDPPLAPAVCARMAGTTIDLERILEAWHRLRRMTDVVVVEGAGGLLVPINETETMADVAAALQVPVLVVALPGLGTLNHTALTVEAARARGLVILGVALSRFPHEPDAAEATNPAELERLCGVEIVGVVPEVRGLEVDVGLVPDSFEAPAWLAPRLGGRFDREAFVGRLAPNELTPTRGAVR